MRLAVMDCETDPQDYNGEYLPFVIGFFDGETFRSFWDDKGKHGSCVQKWVDHIKQEKEKYLIYAHNGGKFDYMFLLDHFQGSLMIQNGRIIRAWIGQHEMRDSYSIIPVALDKFQGQNQKWKFKDKEEKRQFYLKYFSRANREKHKKMITDYLADDCYTLHEGVKRFRDEFGNKLTIGGTAMSEIKKLYSFDTLRPDDDAMLREYYFGGRNQCFDAGIIEGNFKIYDINSMYPYVMKEFQHPISASWDETRSIKKNTTFAEIEAKNYGCLPVRSATGLDFTVERGTFKATIHEINAGMETGTLEILKVNKAISHHKTINFAKFVDIFYEKRNIARHANDELLVMFYKLILNSGYGKFGQNPEHFSDYMITHNEIPSDVCGPKCPVDCAKHWRIEQTNGNFYIWFKPSERKQFYNVATAASITGAARSMLLRGLATAKRPIYCDTDSIICEAHDGQISDSILGAWKIEGEGSCVAIAGKKLYAVLENRKTIKKASKGADIPASDILKLCKGGSVEITSPVPHFKFTGTHAYVTRKLKRTIAEAKSFRPRT